MNHFQPHGFSVLGSYEDVKGTYVEGFLLNDQRNARGWKASWESIKTYKDCLLYTSPSPRDRQKSRMPSSA